jgi:hypothetical protein
MRHTPLTYCHCNLAFIHTNTDLKPGADQTDTRDRPARTRYNHSTPAKKLLPEPWVFEKQFEGKLERWVRGARAFNDQKNWNERYTSRVTNL